jgi:hypothetical protein
MARNLSTVSLMQSSNETSVHRNQNPSARGAATPEVESRLTPQPELLFRLARIQREDLAVRLLPPLALCQPVLQIRVLLPNRIDDGLVGKAPVANNVPLVLALDRGLEVGLGDVPHVGKLRGRSRSCPKVSNAF